jgi:hypothetical protein
MINILKENYYLIILYIGFLFIYITKPNTKVLVNYPDLENVKDIELSENNSLDFVKKKFKKK